MLGKTSVDPPRAQGNRPTHTLMTRSFGKICQLQIGAAAWLRAWPSAVRRVAPPLAGRCAAGQRHGLRGVECLPARPGIGQFS